MRKKYLEPSITLVIQAIEDVLLVSNGFTEGLESDPFTGNPWEV